MTENLQDLLTRLKEASRGRPPLPKELSEETRALMQAIRAHGEAAIEPLIVLIETSMAENWEIYDEGPETTWFYVDRPALELLVEQSITEAMVTRLYALVAQYEDDDSYFDTLMEILPRAGAVVIEPMLAVLRDRTNDVHFRNGASEVLGGVAEHHADLRDRIADALVAMMSSVSAEDEDEDDRTVNAFMLMALEETRAERYIPFVEQMFERNRVDLMMTDLDLVRDSIQGIDPMLRHPTLDSKGFDAILQSRLGRALFPQPPVFPAQREQPSRGRAVTDSVTPYHAPKRPGRNEPCWCGSGKKYKHCHLRDDQEQDRRKSS